MRNSLRFALSFWLISSLLTLHPARAGFLSFSTTKLIAITGATLMDGSGRAPSKNSVIIIRGDTVDAVGRAGQVRIPAGAQVVDARGLVVAPGFVDTHNHSERGLEADPTAATQVSQGITTLAVGQDGGSEFPIGKYLSKLDNAPAAVNVLTFVGHATLRSLVMGEDTDRAASAKEVQKMTALVEQGMREGAFGLSSGLEYETGKKATIEEMIALAGRAGRHGGIYMNSRHWDRSLPTKRQRP